MPGCCDPRAYDEAFSDRFARRVARRYRRRGLDRLERAVVDEVVAHGVDGATVLEVGGGVGQVCVELLRRGAAAATCLELATTYEREAGRLAAEAGVGERMTRRRVDIAAEPDAAGPADVVVLNKVVCCYPDQVALLRAAADHARGLVVFSYPRANAVSRAVVAVMNRFLAMSGAAYRAYLHDPADMLATLAGRGLTSRMVRRGPVWQVAVAVRA